jgi:nitrite reductase/ring-hydroxylating ferredoxin subunit
MSVAESTTSRDERRRFLGMCGGGCAALLGLSPLLAACASLVTRTVRPVDGRIDLALAQYPELTEPRGSLKIVPEGQSEPIYVLSLPDASFAALSPICTHLGCTVDISGEVLICPCHGSTYDRGGKVLRGPAERALTRYGVTSSEKGVITIHLRGAA